MSQETVSFLNLKSSNPILISDLRSSDCPFDKLAIVEDCILEDEPFT